MMRNSKHWASMLQQHHDPSFLWQTSQRAHLAALTVSCALSLLLIANPSCTTTPTEVIDMLYVAQPAVGAPGPVLVNAQIL
jgi:hypothetical protein